MTSRTGLNHSAELFFFSFFPHFQKVLLTINRTLVPSGVPVLPSHPTEYHSIPHTPLLSFKITMSLSDINVVELATRFVDLRNAKKSSDAVDLFVTDETMIDVPGVIGSSTYKGKAKILKKWKSEDKEDFKLISEEAWRFVKPGVATRQLKAEWLFLKMKLQHTITFNSAGKITHMLVKKQ